MDIRMVIETQAKLQYGIRIDHTTYQTFVNTVQDLQPVMIPETYIEIIKQKYTLIRNSGCCTDNVIRAFLLVFHDYMHGFLQNTNRRPYLRWELQTALFDNWKGWMYPEPCGAVMMQLMSIVKPTRKRRRSLSLDDCECCDCCE
jgi:hypothetical protein